ncbi:MAG TPA: ABA4-like family protein [Puia sp.]|nr:ABA4-like family protein [Puia sp.]
MNMTPDTIFTLSSAIAALGWLILIVASPFWARADKFVVGIIIALLALVYTGLNFANFRGSDLPKFFSLDGIQSIYQNKALLTAGWVHFLAFDLMVAVWIKRNSVKYRIAHGLIIPVLVFTCMLGPLGFLIYLLVRWIKTKDYFAQNFW